LNLLIVDDEAVSLRRLQYFLEAWEHNVITAVNGIDALKKFNNNNIDIIITDWLMPEMDGPELVYNIRRQKNETPYVYIMLLTVKEEKEGIVKALLDREADDYIVKPFDPDVLRARLNVGMRAVRLERKLKKYSYNLEKLVRRQTRVIRHTQEETIIRLLTALESRDQETGGHVRRIALSSVVIATAANWPSNKIDDLRLAAPMHDIGKIGVPDSILLKKGPLTETEFEIIKTHTTIGGQILGDSDIPMLQIAHDIALYHHEKWNGTGYPSGIAGNMIPESARIVAIVDVFDALSHDRVYKKALPEKEVIKIMKKEKGTHFDPRFFDLFIKTLPELMDISKQNVNFKKANVVFKL